MGIILEESTRLSLNPVGGFILARDGLIVRPFNQSRSNLLSPKPWRLLYRVQTLHERLQV
jgi:hypothetical protein